MPRETRSLDGWRAQAIPLSLDGDDIALVDNALCLVPQLRAVVHLGREARKRGVSYPVKSAAQLVRLVGKRPLRVAGHRIDSKSIAHAMAKEWFPILHEGELLSAMHLAIRRCEAEAEAATQEKLRKGRPFRDAKSRTR